MWSIPIIVIVFNPTHCFLSKVVNIPLISCTWFKMQTATWFPCVVNPTPSSPIPLIVRYANSPVANYVESAAAVVSLPFLSSLDRHQNPQLHHSRRYSRVPSRRGRNRSVQRNVDRTQSQCSAEKWSDLGSDAVGMSILFNPTQWHDHSLHHLFIYSSIHQFLDNY